MNIQQRLEEAKQKFEEKQKQRAEYLKNAEDCLIEMYKLQGSFTTLEELQEKSEKEKKSWQI